MNRKNGKKGTVSIGDWGGGWVGGTGLLAAPLAPTITLTSGATDNQPDFLVTAANADLPIGAVVTLYAYTDVGLTTLEDTGTGTVAVAGTLTITNQLGPLVDGTKWYVARTDITGHTTSANSNTETNTIDTVAPTLSSPTGLKTGSTTASLSVSTNEGSGTAWVVVCPSGESAPTGTQIKAGQKASGAAAAFADNKAVVSTGVQTFAGATALSANTSYKAHYAQEDTAGNTSNVSSTTAFTTDASYAGPGDAVSFLAWWGLRGYSTAVSNGTTKAITVTKASDGSVDTDIVVLSTGALDVATISGLGYAVKVKKIWDQTGNGFHLVEATLSNMPVLTLSALGSLPGMTFTRAATSRLACASNMTQAQPLTGSWVAKRTGSFTNYQTVLGMSDGSVQTGFDITADHVFAFTGNTLPAASATDSAAHVVQAVLNAASSTLRVDGSSTSVNLVTTTGLAVAPAMVGATGNGVDGVVFEAGFIGSSSLAAEANQRAYYGI